MATDACVVASLAMIHDVTGSGVRDWYLSLLSPRGSRVSSVLLLITPLQSVLLTAPPSCSCMRPDPPHWHHNNVTVYLRIIVTERSILSALRRIVHAGGSGRDEGIAENSCTFFGALIIFFGSHTPDGALFPTAPPGGLAPSGCTRRDPDCGTGLLEHFSFFVDPLLQLLGLGVTLSESRGASGATQFP